MRDLLRRLGLAFAVAASLLPSIPVGLTLCHLPGGDLPVRVVAGDCSTTACQEDACGRPSPSPDPRAAEAGAEDPCDCCMSLVLGGTESPGSIRTVSAAPVDLPYAEPATAFLPAAFSARTAPLPRRAEPPPTGPASVPLRI